ncbi:hypothetical protein AVEN_14746-1 [Araneus ventricosus]|uniref:Uncharacterized protein n=1 Tax=Araneus ventricosus TaxID=182803 RepID=A0A4Y2MCC2_ARAVE|nr:hypothetical protein AVEN_14746-1 [Araneus ventricosus]
MNLLMKSREEEKTLTQLSTLSASCRSSSCSLGPVSSRNCSTICRVASYWAAGTTALSPVRYRFRVRERSGTGWWGSSCGERGMRMSGATDSAGI